MYVKGEVLDMTLDVMLDGTDEVLKPLQVTGLDGKLAAVPLKPGESLTEAFLRIRRACEDLGRPYLISAE